MSHKEEFIEKQVNRVLLLKLSIVEQVTMIKKHWNDANYNLNGIQVFYEALLVEGTCSILSAFYILVLLINFGAATLLSFKLSVCIKPLVHTDQ